MVSGHKVMFTLRLGYCGDTIDAISGCAAADEACAHARMGQMSPYGIGTQVDT
jgi:hypothetical protein